MKREITLTLVDDQEIINDLFNVPRLKDFMNIHEKDFQILNNLSLIDREHNTIKEKLQKEFDDVIVEFGKSAKIEANICYNDNINQSVVKLIFNVSKDNEYTIDLYLDRQNEILKIFDEKTNEDINFFMNNIREYIQNKIEEQKRIHELQREVFSSCEEKTANKLLSELSRYFRL